MFRVALISLLTFVSAQARPPQQPRPPAAPVHFTAEQLLREAQAQQLPVSRATVYNTLRLFTERGLLRELPIEGVEMVYDSTVKPHHHGYDVVTGEVYDIDAQALHISGLAALTDWDIDGVEVVVRGRRKPATA